MVKRILLAGGGTGGHVFPLIAVAGSLAEKAPEKGIDLELLILGEGKFLKEAAEQTGIKYNSILAGKMRRYFSLLNFLDIFKVPIGFLQSLWHVFRFMPDLVFAKGGYASFTPALAAKVYLIPLFVHESDSVPGLANKLLGKMAKVVFTSFQNIESYFTPGKCVLVGNPIRPEVLNGNREEAFPAFNLNKDKKTILILGGSQGAKRINEIVLDSLAMLTKDFQIIHQCGEGLFGDVQTEAEKLIKEGQETYGQTITENYRVYPFLNARELQLAYAAADVIVARAGANIFELAAVGKPSIVVPLPGSAGDHQVFNANEFQKHGAVVIDEGNLTAHILMNEVNNLLKPENYAAVCEKIKSFAMPDAADKIAEYLLNNLN